MALFAVHKVGLLVPHVLGGIEQVLDLFFQRNNVRVCTLANIKSAIGIATVIGLNLAVCVCPLFRPVDDKRQVLCVRRNLVIIKAILIFSVVICIKTN